MKIISADCVIRFFSLDLAEWVNANLRRSFRLDLVELNLEFTLRFCVGCCGRIETSAFSSRVEDPEIPKLRWIYGAHPTMDGSKSKLIERLVETEIGR
ncbi:hypothetical protein PVK06_026964 [Gossypium arboreum]|uniref:Uncharacterized protein n=1 Tax=Gossypium arboreum TaxID=29729 RepID=A0ABR0P202_GOSAR|nr:hypothetical protein PVK06_026964 [Gossypium arboreum]